jgi:peroxiredoxin
MNTVRMTLWKRNDETLFLSSFSVFYRKRNSWGCRKQTREFQESYSLPLSLVKVF